MILYAYENTIWNISEFHSTYPGRKWVPWDYFWASRIFEVKVYGEWQFYSLEISLLPPLTFKLEMWSGIKGWKIGYIDKWDTDKSAYVV